MDASDFGHVHEHDWVLVRQIGGGTTFVSRGGKNGRVPVAFLWACPCGEFKWTSYAEWESGRDADNVQFSTLSAETVRPTEWDKP